MNKPGKYSKKANRGKEEDKIVKGVSIALRQDAKKTKNAQAEGAHALHVRREDTSEEQMYAKRHNPEAQGEYQKTLLPVHRK